MVIRETTQHLLSQSNYGEETVEVEETSENIMLQSEKCYSFYRREKDFERHSSLCHGLISRTVRF